MNINIKFGKHLKYLRKLNGLSQEQLSEISSLDRSYISEIEGGKKNISLITLDKIAKSFNLTLSELLNFQ